MKLLRPFTGTGAIFFPVGSYLDGGTCISSTKDCRKYCYAKDLNDFNFDEDLRISEDEKKEILRLFKTESVEWIKNKIIRDLDGLQTNILHWFGSGDCLSDLEDKITSIMEAVPRSVTQMGFTRNKRFWKRHKRIFALSIETLAEATHKDGLYSIPNYKEQISVIYSSKYEVRGGYCGPLTCRDIRRDNPELEHYINCKTCLRLKSGCFDRRNT